MDLAGVYSGPVFAELTNHRKDISDEEALRQFDAYFLAQILKGGTPAQGQEDTLLDGGKAGRMYRDFFHQELARIVAEQSDIGLARGLGGVLHRRGASEEEAAKSGTKSNPLAELPGREEKPK